MKTNRWIETGAVAAMLAAGPSLQAAWMDNLTVSGDARIRFQRTDEESKDDRDRLRFRGRIGVGGQVNEQVAIGLRVSTGEERDARSDDQTATDGFDKKEVGIRAAFIDWTVADGLHLIGGKMEQPWISVGDLVFDPDVCPEGVAASYKHKLAGVELIASASQMVAMENKDDEEVTLAHAQVAAKLMPDLPFTVLAGASLFAWDQAELLAEDDPAEYNIVEGFVEIGTTSRIPVAVNAQVAVNTEADDDDTGYRLGVRLGNAKAPGSFETGYAYRYLEKYCVMPDFTDNGDTGDGTDVSVHIPYVRYVIAKNFDVKVQYAMAERGLDDGHDLNTWKIDFSAKF